MDKPLAQYLQALHEQGQVQLRTAQEAVRVRRHAEGIGLVVGLSGRPGDWKVYDLGRGA